MAKTNQLLQSLPDADLAGLDEHFKTVELRQGEVLAEPGDDIRNVYFPHSGINPTPICRTSMTGARTLLSL